MIVKGNVEDEVKITLKMDLNKNAMHKKKLKFFGNHIKGEGIVCSSQYQDIFMGPVRIGEGIFTLNNVIRHSDNKFEIRSEKGVTVLVDGVTYSGQQVLIKPDRVIVDGNKMHREPQCIIHGDVGNNVKIISDLSTTIHKNVGNSCYFLLMTGNFSAKNIGKNAYIDVSANISVTKAERESLCISHKGSFIAEALDPKVTVHAKDKILIKYNVAESCQLRSDSYIKTEDIGAYSIIETPNMVYSGNIGNYCKITSDKRRIMALGIGSYVDLFAKESIDAEFAGAHSTLICIEGTITLDKPASNIHTIDKDDIKNGKSYKRLHDGIKTPQELEQAEYINLADQILSQHLESKIQGPGR